MPKTLKANTWIEVRVEVGSALVEGVANFLIELGSPGVVREKINGKQGGARERVVAYFQNPRTFPGKKKRIRKYLSCLSPPSAGWPLQYRLLREEKWAETWKRNFKPLRVTPRMVVKPPWEKYAPREGERVIEIDPGMAFGTGAHATTRLCLQGLEALIPSFLHPPSVLDFGTGSGILAIAAQKMGAKETVAVDIDPAAIRSARKNASANRLAGRIDFRVGSGESLRRRFEIVVANLLPQELLRAVNFLSRRAAPAGFVVVSGMLRKQKEEIAAAFAEKRLRIHAYKSDRDWICMVFTIGPKDRALGQKLSAAGFLPDRPPKMKDGLGKEGF